LLVTLVPLLKNPSSGNMFIEAGVAGPVTVITPVSPKAVSAIQLEGSLQVVVTLTLTTSPGSLGPDTVTTVLILCALASEENIPAINNTIKHTALK
jgi:hypothetical protein